MTRLAPHSIKVWMAAAQVPPVAMMGSRMMARSEGVSFDALVYIQFVSFLGGFGGVGDKVG